MEIVLSCIVIASVLTQAWFWTAAWFDWNAGGRSILAEKPFRLPGLSVVVAARNEAAQLPELLRSLAGQHAVNFEVLVVDDGSTDDTVTTVERFCRLDPRIRLIQRREGDAAGKRSALATGIAAARNEIIVLTDADCRPPETWLERVAERHAADPDTVWVGYGPMVIAPTLLNRLVRFETVISALLARSGIGLGIPFMAVGRNLSYPRAVYERVGGFGDHEHILSGDDDLFVQRVVRMGAGTVKYLDDPETFVRSEAPASWLRWLKQKRRHHSAGRRYALRPALLLSLFWISGLALWLSPILVGQLGLALLAVKLAMEAITLRRITRRLKEPGLVGHTVYLDLMYILYIAIVGTLGLLFPPKRW